MSVAVLLSKRKKCFQAAIPEGVSDSSNKAGQNGIQGVYGVLQQRHTEAPG